MDQNTREEMPSRWQTIGWWARACQEALLSGSTLRKRGIYDFRTQTRLTVSRLLNLAVSVGS